jgi:cytochrome c-type biogenesis protein CcmF
MSPLLFLMAIGPFANWKEASIPEILRTLRWAFAASVVVAIAIPLAYGEWTCLDRTRPATRRLGSLASVVNFVGRVQHTRAGRSFLSAALSQPRSFVGMHVAHIGIAVFVVGVTMVNSFQEEKDVKMAPGERSTVAGYTFTFNGVKAVKARITWRRRAISILRSTASSSAK